MKVNHETVKIEIVRGSMEPYGDGWKWQLKVEHTYDEANNRVTTYRTNKEGEGLWQCGSHEGPYASNHEDHQIQGTTQFSLYKVDRVRARRIIRRYFERQYD